MPQRFFCLVVVSIFLFNGEIFGQSTAVENNFKDNVTPDAVRTIISLEKMNITGIDKLPKNYSLQTILRPAILTTSPLSPGNAINLFQKNYYIKSLSFFCRTEWQFEKATSVPLRVRLGSLEYTDYLEQKPNAARPR
jgi:hypothetical protein